MGHCAPGTLLFDFEDSSGEGWREYMFSVREDYALTRLPQKDHLDECHGSFDTSSVSVKGSIIHSVRKNNKGSVNNCLYIHMG